MEIQNKGQLYLLSRTPQYVSPPGDWPEIVEECSDTQQVDESKYVLPEITSWLGCSLYYHYPCQTLGYSKGGKFLESILIKQELEANV